MPDEGRLLGEWRVDDIDQRGIIDFSMVTLVFTEDARVNGNSGCNPYFGGFKLQLPEMTFSALGSGRRACAPALMNQEQRFFKSLDEVTNVVLTDNGILLLKDSAGESRIRAVRVPAVLDRASDQVTRFNCGGAFITTRFLGPDTIELSRDGETYVLTSERAASGAKYTSDEAMFWNKGDSAMLEIAEQKLNCERSG